MFLSKMFEMNLFVKETTAGGLNHKDASQNNPTALQKIQFKMFDYLKL